MEAVYHEAFCRYELDDIVKLNKPTQDEETYKIEEIRLLQFVRAAKMEFEFQLRRMSDGKLSEGWFPNVLMGEIVQYRNGEKPKR